MNITAKIKWHSIAHGELYPALYSVSLYNDKDLNHLIGFSTGDKIEVLNSEYPSFKYQVGVANHENFSTFFYVDEVIDLRENSEDKQLKMAQEIADVVDGLQRIPAEVG